MHVTWHEARAHCKRSNISRSAWFSDLAHIPDLCWNVLTKRPFRACSNRSTKCHLACVNICAITPSPRRTAHHYRTNFISVPMAPVPIAVAPAPVISASPAATAAAPPPASATYPNADATAASASVMATPATVTSAAVMAPSTAVAAVPSTAVAAVTTMADKLYE
jgi:hypothetical protein